MGPSQASEVSASRCLTCSGVTSLRSASLSGGLTIARWSLTRQLTLAGSAASCGEYPACLNLIARGAVQLDAIISAVAPLSQGAAWFQRLYRGEEGLMKVILEP